MAKQEEGAPEGAERIGADEARARLGELIDRTWAKGETIVITRHADDRVVLIGIDQYRALTARRPLAAAAT